MTSQQHPLQALCGGAMQFLQEQQQKNPVVKQLRGGLSQLQSRCQGIGKALQQQARARHQRAPAPSVMVMPRHACLAAIIPGDTVVEQVTAMGLLNFLNLYNSALVVRLVLTWFPNPPAVLINPLATICDPYLNLFRGVIPPLGGTLDLSPILAFLLLNFLTSTAQALPAELGPDGRTPVAAAKRQQSPLANVAVPDWLRPSKYEVAWRNMVAAQRSRQEGAPRQQ